LAQRRTAMPQHLLKTAPSAALLFVGLAGGIQFIPYGRDHTPVPATNPFQWHSPEVQTLAKAACYDCHSNETRWWWAVKIAPFSWLAQSDIHRGKRHVDFSAWNGRLTAAGLQRALDRNMPPWYYTLIHPEARLSDPQKQTLVRGFQASLGASTSTFNSSPLVMVSFNDPSPPRSSTPVAVRATHRGVPLTSPFPAQSRPMGSLI
jgi:hypothetical protein